MRLDRRVIILAATAAVVLVAGAAGLALKHWLKPSLPTLCGPKHALAITAEANRPLSEFGCGEIKLYTLTNRNGLRVRITNFGGRIVSVMAPDRNGQLAEVVQGFDRVDAYLQAGFRYGALVGRFHNRIKDNTYVLDGVRRHVTPGEGYDVRVWTATMRDGEEPQLVLTLLDPDGAQGFPGTVQATAVYTLTQDNVLRIDFRAVTDKDTVMSVTNHAYFNLAGVAPGRKVLDHLLTVNAEAYTINDDEEVPTGEVRPVAGTPFDFRTPTPIGQRIAADDPMLNHDGGYDVNYVLNGEHGTLRLAARLEEPQSGRVVEAWTTQAGLQIFTANELPPVVQEAKGWPPHGAVALEPQAFPNAPNIASFPDAEVTPQRPLHEIMEFRFGVAPPTAAQIARISAGTPAPR